MKSLAIVFVCVTGFTLQRLQAQIPVALGDFAPGLIPIGAPSNPASNPRSFFPYGQRVAFIGTLGVEDLALFLCDPDGANAQPAMLLSDVTSATIEGGFNQTLVVGLGRNGASISELWCFDPNSGRRELIFELPAHVAAPARTIIRAAVQSMGSGAIVVMQVNCPSDSCEPQAIFTDGTAAGTQILVSGSPSSFRGGLPLLARTGERMVFSVADEFGLELWSTDGTPAGSMRVSDQNPGPGSSSPSCFIAIDTGVVYISTSAGYRGILRTDGTAAGTQMLLADEQITEGAAVRVGSRAVFLCPGGVWTTDGTQDGTQRLTFENGDAIRSGKPQVVLGEGPSSRLLCFLRDPTSATRLSVTDGTAAGTQILVAVNGFSDLFEQEVRKSGPLARAYLRAGAAVVESDGTTGGTFVRSSPLSFQSSMANEEILTPSGLLTAGAVSGSDYELAIADGQPSVARVVSNLNNPGNGGVAFGPTLANGVPMAAGRVLAHFRMGEGVQVTSAQVRVNVIPRTRAFGAVGDPAGGRFVFGGNGDDGQPRLWVSDGTAAQTLAITGTAGSHSHRHFTTRQGVAYFVARTNTGQIAVMRTDGAVDGQGTRTVFTSSSLTDVADITEVGDAIYFLAAMSTLRLYRINPATEQATLVGTVISSGQTESGFVGTSSTHLYVRAFNFVSGTGLIAALTLSTGALQIVEPDAVVGGAAMTSAGLFVRELKANRVDRIVGPALVSSIPLAPSGNGYQVPTPQAQAAALNDLVLLSGHDASTGEGELWAIRDGTPDRVRDIYPGVLGARIGRMQAVGDRVVFTARGLGRGRELFVSDGTTEGTKLLGDVRSGPLSGLLPELNSPGMFVRLGNILVFGADDGFHGEEPYAISLCLADFNSDGDTNADDLADYINHYFSAEADPGEFNYADVNRDNSVDSTDLADFISAFFTGCS